MNLNARIFSKCRGEMAAARSDSAEGQPGTNMAPIFHSCLSEEACKSCTMFTP